MSELHVLEQGVQRAVWLPPPDARKWDVDRLGKLETPLDTNGLVDLNELVALGKQTVVSDYDWTSQFNDIHHLQWPGVLYSSGDVPEISQVFRELVRRKAYLPRQFHNWLHYLTIPPELPTEEVMRHAIRAEHVARALAATAQLAVKLTRMPHIPEVKLIQRLGEEFDNYTLYVENAREVPEEFQLLKLAEVEAKSIDEMLAANRKLGKWALNHIPVYRRKILVA